VFADISAYMFMGNEKQKIISEASQALAEILTEFLTKEALSGGDMGAESKLLNKKQ